MWRTGRAATSIVAVIAALVGAALQACAPGAFECIGNDDCVDGSARGTCEPTGFCSFADVACPSMRRYGDLAGDGLGGVCVEDGTTSDDTNASATTSAMSASTTEEPTSSGPDPVETEGPKNPYGSCRVTADCSDPTAVCVTNGDNHMCAPTCTMEGTPSSECPLDLDGDLNGVGCLFTDAKQTVTRCFAVCDSTVDCPGGMICVSPVCTWVDE